MHPETNVLDLEGLTAAARLLNQGPADLDWLTRRLRSELKDPRVTVECVTATVMTTTVLIGRPDGRVCRLVDVLEGQTLTHRVPAATAGRTDLWTNLSLQPLYAYAGIDPLPLTTGGELTAGRFGHAALIGPPGWLPDVPAGGLVGLTVERGRVRVVPLPEGVNASPEHEQQVRATLAQHIREEAWWSDYGEPNREAELNRAIGHALLEDPDLFRRPLSPLTELLHDVLSEHSRRHLFDDVALGGGGGRVVLRRRDARVPPQRAEPASAQVRHVLRPVRGGDPRPRGVAHTLRRGPRALGGLGRTCHEESCTDLSARDRGVTTIAHSR